MTSRRGFLIGLGAVLAAPAVVKAESLMKIAVLRDSVAFCRRFANPVGFVIITVSPPCQAFARTTHDTVALSAAADFSSWSQR